MVVCNFLTAGMTTVVKLVKPLLWKLESQIDVQVSARVCREGTANSACTQALTIVVLLIKSCPQGIDVAQLWKTENEPVD